MKISREFISKWLEIRDGLGKLFISTVDGNNSVKNVSELRKGLKDTLTGVLMAEAGVSSGSEDEKIFGALADFLATSSIIAFLDGFDVDRAVSDNPEFGFTELGDIVRSGLEVKGSSSGDSSVDAEKVCSGLLSMVRGIPVREYLEQSIYMQDIQLVVEFCTPKEEDLSEDDLMKAIESNTILYQFIEDTRDAILAVYKVLFQDSFGLRPYYGVLSGNKSHAGYYINDSNKLVSDSQSNSFFSAVYDVLSKSLDVEIDTSRQFDYKKVLASGKPVYFPKKILEFAMGRQLTSNLNLDFYQPFEKAESYEDYEKGYVKPYMHAELRKVVYSFCKDNGWTTSDDFAESSVALAIKDLLKKVQRSYCTAIVVTSYNNLGGKINSIAVRVSNTSERLRPNLTKSLFEIASTNEKAQYRDGLDLSSGQYVNNDTSKPLPFDVFEFRHDFDATLSQAEPLFGYKAVEMFLRRKVQISWSNILVGESISSTPVFCGYGAGKLPIQGNVSHNMMAGSRSGKGVMTMNILSCALASNKAIFYVDRKPDMAVMFQELTNGNMFIVNGGQYEAANDPNKVFAEGSTTLLGWNDPCNMPDYVFKLLGSPAVYSSNFADLVYLRAMLLCFSILVTRVAFATNEEIYNKLGGADGVVFVFDEFKNWQEVFERKFLHADGVFCNAHRLSKTDRESVRKAKLEIMKKQMELEAPDLKPAKRAAIEMDIKMKAEQIASAVTPEKVYCTQLMDKIEETITVCREKTSAGFYGNANEEVNKIDLFVIGQHIEIDGLDGLFERRDSGLFNTNEHNKGKSIMRGLIDTFKHDWFMGYNQDGDNQKRYLGASSAGSLANKYVTGMQYWAYCNGTAMADLRTSCPSNAVFFKPYLVLNNANEDDPNNPKMMRDASGKDTETPDPNYKFVAGCRGRVNQAVPGLWETVRLKHVANPDEQDVRKGGTPQYGTLNRGIGFEGLAEVTMQTSGNNVSFVDVLAKSKSIADFVAQCMGYVDYKALLFDMSPNGLFSAADVVEAIRDPEKYTSNIALRLPLFAEFDMLEGKHVGLEGESEEHEVYDGYDEDYEDLESYASEYSEADESSSSSPDSFEGESEFGSSAGFNTQDSSSGSEKPFGHETFEEARSRRYSNTEQQSAGKTYTEADYRAYFSHLYDKFKAAAPNFGEPFSKSEVVDMMVELIIAQDKKSNG